MGGQYGAGERPRATRHAPRSARQRDVESSAFREAGCNHGPAQGILCTMGSRLLAAAVVIATVLSTGLLGVMLAAPLLSQPTALVPRASETPVPSEVAEELPPLGIYLLRGPSAYGPCLGLELTPLSYPVGEDAGAGTATVSWWQPGISGCDGRTGEVHGLDATVERVPRDDAPNETLGYAVSFSLPLAIDVATPVQLTILSARSTQVLLQVVDSGAGGTGEGLVFDLVDAIDPIDDPIPSPPAVGALQPVGLYLLEGPLTDAGPCLVLELVEQSYPPDATTAGSATVRWWDRAIADPDDPVACLSRSGDVHTIAASIVPVTDPDGELTSYHVQFFLPTSGTREGQVVDMSVEVNRSTVDQLNGAVAGTDGGVPVTLDRVDSIDPPLVTP